MKFLITKEKIFNLLKKINNITYSNIDLYYDSNILLYIKNNYLKVVGNNLEIEISSKIDFNESFNKNLISVSYKKLLNICKSIYSNTIIEFFSDEKYLFLKTEKSIFSLLLISVKKYPKFDIGNKIFEICLSRKNFLYLIKSTYFSIAIQDIRVCLNGMLFELNLNKIKTITTDGHRLSTSKILINQKIEFKHVFILYRKSIIELIKFLDNNKNNDNLILIIYNKFISINIENSKFISRLLNENFPNCDNIINNNYLHNILINRILLKDAIYRISSILEDKFNLIKLNFFENKILISSKNKDSEYAKEEININYSGNNLKIGLNFNYLIDILSSLEETNIIFKFSNNISSIEINNEFNKNKKYIIMPIRI